MGAGTRFPTLAGENRASNGDPARSPLRPADAADGHGRDGDAPTRTGTLGVPGEPVQAPDASGLRAVCGIAAYYQIAADPTRLQRDLGLIGRGVETEDLVRAARAIGLKARIVTRHTRDDLAAIPTPAIVALRDGGYAAFTGRVETGQFRLVDPVTNAARLLDYEELRAAIEPRFLLIGRRAGGEGRDPNAFGLSWFWPSVWRYRRPLAQVLVASLTVQVFALVTPLFFQVIVDKVLVHKGYATLLVLVAGIAIVAVFDTLLQYLRTYTLAHTTNRIDIELGQRLFGHLLRLPLSYFETRPAGQTIARVRELETIREFLTGQGLFSALDLVFTFVFVAVLFAYSWQLTLIVLVSIPVYVAIGVAVRPLLRDRVQEKFNRFALSQQYLVEAIVGIQTVKASAVEPVMRAQWEERLAAYVRTSFAVTMLGAGGQNAVQFVGRIVSALLILFGALAVIDGRLTVGGLVAFTMIAAQVTQPVLRLSQLWQDFQQVQISIERLGDVLNHPAEPVLQTTAMLPRARGRIAFRNVTFAYRAGSADVLRDVSLDIEPGEVIGIVGPSGSGKSTLTKLVQRLYAPQQGQVLLDGADLSQLDPGWLRQNVGVVLQENLLFNRTIHENIALAAPALPRQHVIAVARLAGADEFIAKLPAGYDTLVEERGANLSGGQRQRIAIARALITNPPVLILDEATSALDYESERIIQDNMRQIAQNRTVIIIAHRLAAVRRCDRILGFVDGRIVEAGDHHELLRRPGGLYARLWSLQNEGARA